MSFSCLLGLLILFRQENLGFPSGSRPPPDLHPGAPLPRDSPICWIFKRESCRLSWLLQWQQLLATSRKGLATALVGHFELFSILICHSFGTKPPINPTNRSYSSSFAHSSIYFKLSQSITLGCLLNKLPHQIQTSITYY